MAAVDELDISMDEFWTGVAYLTQAGKQGEFGLIVPGVALEHFLDLRLDEAERCAGLTGGTARTIEGPLYIAGAPLSKGDHCEYCPAAAVCPEKNGNLKLLDPARFKA
jgi:catechol 1,2-dioxygenase